MSRELSREDGNLFDQVKNFNRVGKFLLEQDGGSTALLTVTLEVLHGFLPFSIGKVFNARNRVIVRRNN